MASTVAAKANHYPSGIFRSEFRGTEPFLADHIIQGQKILPGMAYLEMARAAVSQAANLQPGQVIQLQESVFINALLVPSPKSIEITVFPGVAGEYGIEVTSDSGIHFQSKAIISWRNGPVNPQKLITNIEELKERCPTQGPGKSEFYDVFRRRGVQLGASHRGVEKVWVGEACAFAELSLPKSSQRGMLLDPGMLDSVIQTGFVLAEDPNAQAVPFMVKATEIFAPLEDRLYSFVEKTSHGLNYSIYTLGGELCVRIIGFQTREIDLASQDDIICYATDLIESPLDQLPSIDTTQTTEIAGDGDYIELTKTILSRVKVLVRDKVSRHRLVIKVANHQPTHLGLSGLLKTIHLEHPNIEGVLVYQDKYISDQFSKFSIDSMPIQPWQAGKSYLITGGLGGLGRAIANDIATSCSDARIILVGRRNLNEDDEGFINQLQEQGATISYHVCDLTKETDVIDLVKKIGQVNGVIHGAGLLSDQFIMNKDIETVANVMAVKVAGLKYLDKATAAMPLDFFVVHSSIASALGNLGQSDYAAANGYADHYMKLRQSQVLAGERRGVSLSIQWPLWEGKGMQLTQSVQQELMQNYQIKPMPVSMGINTLKRLLSNQLSSPVLVVYGQKKLVAKLIDTAQKRQQLSAPSQKAILESTASTNHKILDAVKLQVSKHLKIATEKLNEQAEWSELGFDSIMMSSFINRLNSAFNLNLLPTLLFENTHISALANYLQNEYQDAILAVVSPSAAPVQEITQQKANETVEEEDPLSDFAQGMRKQYLVAAPYREKDIAIVGLSCQIANANTAEEFWALLNNEADLIQKVPSDRWDWRAYPGTAPWGSFIDKVQYFDPGFFGISPAEALYMTPEQRLMLRSVWECMEDAGYAGETLKGSNTGLFVGCGPSGYVSLLRDLPVEAYSATGAVASVGPNRISYFMDWHGPSNPIDTACSSALVALHRAVEAIRAGHCDQAVAGGVNLLLSPEGFISFSKSGMLSSDGRCKTFSDKADGYVRGEGVGMLLVKPLSAALEDGDNIYAVIKGTAENHGGRTTSLTAPNPKAQAAVIKKAIQDAGVQLSHLSYIECHGTGTSLGDPVEINGLKMVASEYSNNTAFDYECYLGSVKSNVGHLEYAAGVAGLVKVIMQMKYKTIVKSLHCEKINPYIQLDKTPFKVAQSSMPWNVAQGRKRMAGISSFGFGGANAHVILEEFDVAPKASNEPGAKYLFTFSAKSKECLFNTLKKFPSAIKAYNTPEDAYRAAFTLSVGRASYPYRAAFVGASLADLDNQINKLSPVESMESSSATWLSHGLDALAQKGLSSEEKDICNTANLKRLFKLNSLETIAELWVKGASIDWRKIYEEE